MKYVIAVEETLRRSFIVEADNLTAAITRVEQAYYNDEDIHLDYGDFVDSHIHESQITLELAEHLGYEVFK